MESRDEQNECRQPIVLRLSGYPHFPLASPDPSALMGVAILRPSGELIEDIRDGKLDFAVVREDAIPEGLPSEPLVVVKFILCASRKLLGNKPASSLDDPSLWKKLPFAASAGGGQLDRTFRKAMVDACGSFQPVIECDSLLQIRELVVQGSCAGILAHIGTKGLAELPDGYFRFRRLICNSLDIGNPALDLIRAGKGFCCEIALGE